MVSTIFLLALGMYFTISVLTYNKPGENKSNEDVIKRFKNTVISAFTIGFLGIIIIYIIAQKISKIIVKPVETAFEKQMKF